MARSRVELFEQIRRDRRDGELSIREFAEKYHVHRRTVRQALASAAPPPRTIYPPRGRPVIDPYAEIIDEWLLGCLGAGAAAQIWNFNAVNWFAAIFGFAATALLLPMGSATRHHRTTPTAPTTAKRPPLTEPPPRRRPGRPKPIPSVPCRHPANHTHNNDGSR